MYLNENVWTFSPFNDNKFQAVRRLRLNPKAIDKKPKKYFLLVLEALTAPSTYRVLAN